MWECTLKSQLCADPEMKQYFDSIKIIEPLDPREAFYGGRTNAVKLYGTVARGENGEPLEKIEYTDICSLYPYITKYCKFPIGHPVIITENFADLATEPYEGLIKCKIVPSRGLLHPVLPYRSNGKLTFPLCSTCADSMQQRVPCSHTDEERTIDGAWVSLEVYKALRLGYKVLEIYECWHYEKVEQYDPVNNPTGGLFAEYINTFVRMKQESDGYPSWVETEEDKGLMCVLGRG